MISALTLAGFKVLAAQLMDDKKFSCIYDESAHDIKECRGSLFVGDESKLPS